MQRGALLERRTDGAVQAILKVVLTLVLDYVREQVTEERRVLSQKCVEVQRLLDSGQFGQLDLARRQVAPVRNRELVFGVWPAVAYLLEDHGLSICRIRCCITLNTGRLTYSGVVS